MTKSPREINAKELKKHKDEIRKRAREKDLEKQRYLVAQLRADGLSVRKIAEKIRMSVGFVHKWCLRLVIQIGDIRKARRERYVKKKYSLGEGIRDAIISRSTAPKNPKRKVTREHIDIVTRIRKEKFTKKMGAQKIRVYCGLDISHQTIHRIMLEAGLIKPYKKRKQRLFNPFRRGYPNSLWQIDYKEFEHGIYMLSVKDDHSSMILSADVRTTCTTDDVLEIMERTVNLFGTPGQILSDHGTQWYATNGGASRFDRWCAERGIGHIMGRIGKPTTQGKIERWHGSVLEEAVLPGKGGSADDYRKAVLEYVEFYNNSRPHHGIDLHIPIVVYTAGLILNEVFTKLGVHEVP